MKVLIISGSSRSENLTLRLSKAMVNLFEERGLETALTDFTSYDLPFMNDTESDETPFLKELKAQMERARIIIVLSPEYNWFPSAELVNMIHLLGTKRNISLFDDKVFAFGGVSSGRGGRLPAIQLSSVFEKIISHFNVHSITSPKKFEAHYIGSEVDSDGNLIGEDGFKGALNRFVDYNIQLAVKFS